MEKISALKIAKVLSEVPGTLLALDQERNQWRDRALTAEGTLQKHAEDVRVKKIAAAMREKGLSSASDEDQIEALRKHAKLGRLDVIEEAVNMRPEQIVFGEVADGVHGSSARSDFEQFIMSGD